MGKQAVFRWGARITATLKESATGHHEDETKALFRAIALQRDGYYDSHPGGPPRLSVWQRRMRRAAERILDARLAQEPGLSRLLDAGCGRGDFTLSLAARYPGLEQILGCDFSPELLELARTGASGDARVGFLDGDLTELPLAAASVDVTVCLNVLHHINEQALSLALGELARVTTRVLLLEIKNARSPYFRLHSGRVEGVAVFPTSVGQVRAALGPVGFELVRRRGVFGLEWLSPLVLMEFERAGSQAR